MDDYEYNSDPSGTYDNSSYEEGYAQGWDLAVAKKDYLYDHYLNDLDIIFYFKSISILLCWYVYLKKKTV